jgi:hypothetical protein
VSLERRRQVPADHPIRQMFRSLTEMSFEHIELRDRDLMRYVADLLVEFIHVDNLFRLRDRQGRHLDQLLDMVLDMAHQPPADEREARKHIGDYSLFITGLFPESLAQQRRAMSPEYYIAQGKRAYLIVAEIDHRKPTGSLFRKLSEQFEYCVMALNRQKAVLQDPFYQYLLRQLV